MVEEVPCDMCGGKISDDYKQCPWCGTDRTAKIPKIEAWKCRRCGNIEGIKPYSLFLCPSCKDEVTGVSDSDFDCEHGDGKKPTIMKKIHEMTCDSCGGDDIMELVERK